MASGCVLICGSVILSWSQKGREAGGGGNRGERPAKPEVCVPEVEEGRGRKGGNPDRHLQGRHSVFLKEPDLWLVPFCLDIDLLSSTAASALARHGVDAHRMSAGWGPPTLVQMGPGTFQLCLLVLGRRAARQLQAKAPLGSAPVVHV